MGLGDSLRRLDERVVQSAEVSGSAAQRRAAWGSRYGWSLFLLLGLAVLAFGLWALSADRPALAGGPVSIGGGLVVLSLYLFVRRERG